MNAIAPIHEAQLLSYLRLYGTCTRGLLINFNVKRLVNSKILMSSTFKFRYCFYG